MYCSLHVVLFFVCVLCVVCWLLCVDCGLVIVAVVNAMFDTRRASFVVAC